MERELLAHLEDKAADLARIFPDMEREEAEKRAVEQMGDPKEIGRALAGSTGHGWAGCGG